MCLKYEGATLRVTTSCCFRRRIRRAGLIKGWTVPNLRREHSARESEKSMSIHRDRWPSRSERVAGRADQVAVGQTIASVHAGVVPQATFASSDSTLNVLEADRGSEFQRYPPVS